MTSEIQTPKLPLLPFLIVDGLLIGLAIAIYWVANRPLLLWEALLLVATVAGAACSILYPILRRDASNQSMAQVKALSDSMAQIQKLEQLAAQIANATSQWQSVQESATKIADGSRELSRNVSAETKNFAELLQKGNDAEKNHLRLEVDKLRRAEIEWLQVVTRIMDHVFALYIGAVQSGQRTLIDQIGRFQEVCRDTTRRVGLIPLMAAPGEEFNPEIHQLVDGDKAPEGKPLIGGTLVTGFTYQGQLIRKVVVGLKESEPPQSEEPPTAPIPTTGELGL